MTRGLSLKNLSYCCSCKIWSSSCRAVSNQMAISRPTFCREMLQDCHLRTGVSCSLRAQEPLLGPPKYSRSVGAWFNSFSFTVWHLKHRWASVGTFHLSHSYPRTVLIRMFWRSKYQILTARIWEISSHHICLCFSGKWAREASSLAQQNGVIKRLDSGRLSICKPGACVWLFNVVCSVHQSTKYICYLAGDSFRL